MRPHPLHHIPASKKGWLALLFIIWSFIPLTDVQSQSGEGLFLLLPVGAASVGKGEAVVARKGGTEQIWWNPAGTVGGSTGEVALHHSQTIVGQGSSLGSLIPIRGFGTIGVSLNILDMGAQHATDDQGQTQGRISSMDIAYALTYASQLTKYLALGMTVKHVQLRVSCSGLCTDLPAGNKGVSAADLGAIVSLDDKLPLSIGVAFRHLGVGTGENRPARVDAGVQYRIEAIEKYTDIVKVFTSASIISTTKADSASARFGAEAVIEDWIHVRSGYVFDRAYGSGASIGFGIQTGRVSFDLARTFGGLSATGDQPPTYFSLRYAW